MHPVLGYAYVLVALLLLIYFILLPSWKVFRIPKGFKPVKSVNHIDEEISRRLSILKENPYLKKMKYDFSGAMSDRESYDRIIGVLSEECENIRKKYAKWLFISSTVAQNGFLDAILILSANVNMVKEIFILYNNRVTNRDLLAICEHVYYSVAIGGSEIIESGIEDVVSKLGKELGGGIPIFGKVVGSVSEGFLNAVLLTRVSLITENYCKMVYIKSRKELHPRTKFILSTARDLSIGVTEDILAYLRTKSGKKESAFSDPTFGKVLDVGDTARQLFCGQCGERFDGDYKFCTYCGVEISEGLVNGAN